MTQSPPPTSSGATPPPSTLLPPTILIVDDTPTNLEVLSDALADANYQVAIALDGLSALDQIAYKPPDLILLDVMMPGIDGFETCKRLKANPETEDIPVIFTTALSDTGDKVRGLSLGAVDYITKPFQREEVLARVGVHLRLRELTRNLEDLVEQRTYALNQALEEVKAAQLRLVQSEKMSSLGLLVAGVAHEINNPVNFIQGNLFHARRYVADLMGLIDRYEQQYSENKYPEDKYPEGNADLAAYRDEIDLTFLRQDLPELLSSMQIGAERIYAIVKSLRNFSRLDESDRKSVDLHEGLDSTLLILRSRLKSKVDRPEIQVQRHYGTLPLVECYPGQINQVFMNVVNNAIDALEDRLNANYAAIMQAQNTDQAPRTSFNWQPTITISTEEIADQAHIKIVNNGTPIPAEVIPQLFTPFFTTKPAGKGTGLGLSIAYQIVTEQHQGHLSCQSSDQGVEFLIQIPLRLRT
jgi:signal transduction histidine kinase